MEQHECNMQQHECNMQQHECNMQQHECNMQQYEGEGTKMTLTVSLVNKLMLIGIFQVAL